MKRIVTKEIKEVKEFGLDTFILKNNESMNITKNGQSVAFIPAFRKVDLKIEVYSNYIRVKSLLGYILMNINNVDCFEVIIES